jgi:hypothetical protein
MKMLLITAVAMALSGGAAFSQDHGDHHPAGSPIGGGPMNMAGTPSADMGEHCAMLMDDKREAMPMQEGQVGQPGGAHQMKTPTEAELKAMRERCATMMAPSKEPAAPPKP